MSINLEIWCSDNAIPRGIKVNRCPKKGSGKFGLYTYMEVISIIGTWGVVPYLSLYNGYGTEIELLYIIPHFSSDLQHRSAMDGYQTRVVHNQNSYLLHMTTFRNPRTLSSSSQLPRHWTPRWLIELKPPISELQVQF